jgi:hypothetical protein
MWRRVRAWWEKRQLRGKRRRAYLVIASRMTNARWRVTCVDWNKHRL